MADEKEELKEEQPENVTDFRINRAKAFEDIYSDEVSRQNRQNQNSVYNVSTSITTAAAVRKLLTDAITNKQTLIETSKQLYVTNPIYASVINYLANMFTWQYKVIPHKVWTKSKAKARKTLPEEDYMMIYNHMLEIVDGLSFETVFPQLLTKLFITGATYFTTFLDEDSLTISTIILPEKYCRTVGQTQYGTYIIQFDYSYFTDLGYNKDQLTTFFKSWPKEFKKGYNKYLTDQQNYRWGVLDPAFSSAVLMNEKGIPTLFYILGGILDYEKYQDNELERSDNLLRYLVVHTIPHYEDQLIFEVDEVKALHKSLKKIVDNGDKARLITTYGDVHVDKISDDDDSATAVLANAYKAIFNNGGFNSTIFTSDSVTALKLGLIRDKSYVWKFVQQYTSFYNICINSWLEFKGYEANVDILPISPYTQDEDVKRYKDNATLGIGKIDYIVASGTKQRHIQDVFDLESRLDLTQIVPLQTSYTQTAEDRKQEETPSKSSEEQKEPGIEPSGDEGSEENAE